MILASLAADVVELLKQPRGLICVAIGAVIGVICALIESLLCRPGKRQKTQVPKHVPTTPGAVEIYVGNLSYETDEARLRKEFEKYGVVASARIITNRFSNKSKGFGFVEMPNRPEAEAAIKALHDYELQGRKLRVNEARNK